MRFLSNKVLNKINKRVINADASINPFSYNKRFYTKSIKNRFKPQRNGNYSLVSFYKLQNKTFPKDIRRKTLFERLQDARNSFIYDGVLSRLLERDQFTPDDFYTSYFKVLNNLIHGSSVDLMRSELNFEEFDDFKQKYSGDFTEVTSHNADVVFDELKHYIHEGGSLGISASDIRSISDEIDTNHTGNNNINPRGSKIQYLVIHYTAGSNSKPGAAVGTAKFFQSNTGKGSADFIVDDETMVQYNPDPTRFFCNAVGGGPYTTENGAKMKGIVRNSNSISIEVCSTFKKLPASKGGGTMDQVNHAGWSFTKDCVKMALKLASILMEQYDIPIKNVYRHYDVTGKPCPGIQGWNDEKASKGNKHWKSFKKILKRLT